MAAAGALTAPMERHLPEARQDRWMLELERAAMADAGKAGARGAQASAPAPAAATGAAMPQDDAVRCIQASQQDGASAALPAQHSAARAGGEARWSALAPAGGSAGTALSLAGARAAWPLAAPAQPAPLTALRMTPTAVMQLGAGAAANPDNGAGQEAPAMASAPQAQPQPEGEAYARSLLHVYQSEQGVHAWLRDASLSQTQVRRVVSAMAAELAQAGTPLTAMTVNGQRIMSSASSGDPSGRRSAVDLSGEAADQPLTPFALKGA